MALDNSHVYYYQVQAEIKLCGAKFSKFIVLNLAISCHGLKKVFIERIYHYSYLISDAVDKATAVFKTAVFA